MEDMIKRMKERSRRMMKFMDENSDTLNKEIIQIKSEVDIFNKIGIFSADKGYEPVYFKVKFLGQYEDEFRLVDVHYIHIYNDYGLKLSIYYDKDNSVLSNLNMPYYEMYDNSKTKRFLKHEDDELSLFNEVIMQL